MKYGIYVLAFFAILIGLYPLFYFWDEFATRGLLSQKPEDLLTNTIWKLAFYVHIFAGGLALLLGWSQFSSKIRAKHLALHRRLGQAYLLTVLQSGCSGLYLAFFASGGFWAQMGFGTLALLWLLSTFQAFQAIRQKDIVRHEQWMSRSYALTFAAVTLRLWMPFFLEGLGWAFNDAYPIIAWLAWVPNLMVVEWMIRR